MMKIIRKDAAGSDEANTTWTLGEPNPELARRMLTGVGAGGVLLAGSVSSPMSGSQQVNLSSLVEVEAFVLPINAAGITSSFRSSFHYVDPHKMACWIREQLGDEQLACCIDEINEKELAYAQAVPLIKSALAQRIAQHKRVLGVA